MEIMTRVTSKLKDKSGERIYWPGKPYFDQGFRREFKSAEEKKAFMDKHNFISDGSLPESRGENARKVEKVREEIRERMRKEGKK